MLTALRSFKVLVIWYENSRHLYAESKFRALLELAKRGHQVNYISYSGTLKGRAYQFRATIVERLRFTHETVLMRSVVPLLSLVVFDLIATIRLLSSIDLWDAIILDINTIVTSLPILFVRLFRDSRPALVLRIDTNPVEFDGRPPGFWRRVQYAVAIRLAAKFFDRVLFISPMLARLSSRQLSVPERKIGVWSSCVDMKIFDPSATSTCQAMLDELGPPSRVRVLYHGTISKARGLKDLVDAFALLKKEDIAAALIMLGQGADRDEIVKHVQDKHLEDVVRVIGPVAYSEVPKFIAACDVGILPIPDHIWWRYQCPIKLLEYLAMNRPVIVSNLPAHRWIIGASNIGVYLDGTSAEEIAEGVLEFLRLRNILDASLGRGIVSTFSASAVAAMLEHEIQSLVD